MIFKILKKIIFAIVIIYSLDLLIKNIGMLVPLNILTISIVSFLGFPGLITLAFLFNIEVVFLKEDLYNYLDLCLLEDKLPHAFLIETEELNLQFDTLLQYLYKNKMIQNLNFDNNLNLIVIEPDGKEIKSEAISTLQKRFIYKPVNNKYNIYIIKEAEKMNLSASNKLLKFLEEPNQNIIGFLLAKDSQVVTTIKSRCQIFKIINEKKIEDNKDSELLIDLLMDLTIEKELKLKMFFSKFERTDLIYIIEETILKYNHLLSEKDNQISYYSKIIINLDKILHLLKSNVNIDLVLDKLCIEVKD